MGTIPNLKRNLKSVAEEQLPGLGVNGRLGTLHSVRERTVNRRPALVQYFSLFSNILPQDCTQIVNAARERDFLRGQRIHIEDDLVRQVVLLTSGSAKIVQFGQNGSAVILRLAGPGELVGTLGLSTQGRHCSTAEALRQSEALIWDTGTFESLSRQFPALRLNTAIILGKQLRDMEDRFREVSTERVAARLSRQIVRLMNQVGQRVNGAVEISISREELAQLIGTTLFTVSRLLSEWDRQGIVKTRREAVSVYDLKALVELSESVSQMPLKRGNGSAED